MAQHFMGYEFWAGSDAGSGTDAFRTVDEAVAQIAASEREYRGKALSAPQQAALTSGQRVAFYERGHAAPYRWLSVESCTCGWPEHH